MGQVGGPYPAGEVRGIKKVGQLFVLAMAAYNLTRMRTLAELRPAEMKGKKAFKTRWKCGRTTSSTG